MTPLGGQLVAGLDTSNRLVLGAVILEDALHLAPHADEREVRHEHDESEDTVDGVEGEATRILTDDLVGENERDPEEDEQTESERHDDGGAGDHPAPERRFRIVLLVLVFLDRLVGRVAERGHADLHGLDE